jgi:hypothetical protein
MTAVLELTLKGAIGEDKAISLASVREQKRYADCAPAVLNISR